ncbi:hypothetical protein P3X46_011356 [Hevea brasiliensis]|uniref:Intron-binding protein aquarius N-terminal domain-containing protein n=1 Tax=Hevea brasiliensis TaxID=3981 RepID=A0ABQ9MGZ0_HEVBR|nr:hypothetical protein P3X46_011356 [Hevea brasiliensis]
MTKVYGTGAYDFKRHHVAEFPVEIQTQLSHKPVESKPGSTLPNSITLLEIQRDRLTKIAAANWLKTGGGSSSMQSKQEKNEFDPELVEQIYETELKGKDGNNTLENYLWPNFDPETATFEHVMFMILMINEKFRENVAPWLCFYDRKDVFKGFLERVLRLKEGRELSIAEKTNYLVFMINAFQSLEDEIVSETVLKLGSLQSWYSLSYGRFQMGLCVNTDLIKKWKRMIKREDKEVLDFQAFPQRSIVSEDGLDSGFKEVDAAAILYCERFMEFLIDLLSQLPTANKELRELALSNIGAVHKLADLSKKLSMLSPEELKDLVCFKQSQKEAINALPLYPNEQIMWDESIVPSINYSGEGCLAFPKLNLQFLTLHDYLLRNFNLFRLESTYDLRETAFRGWSRMAVPIKEFKIAEVKQPNIGEVKPSSVTAEVTFSISSYKAQIRSGWNALKEHDPLSAEEAGKATVPLRLGLQYVRGCEIIEIRDEEGTLMNDFTGRIKRDEWKPPQGKLRTVTVALDTAQYHMDVTDIADKGTEDVYRTFNVLMRRKPKENNFKAISESIRDLMNEYCIVPDWLHNIFLGYENPSAAHWTNMPDLLETVDFKDTVLDAEHLKESFPDYQTAQKACIQDLPFELGFLECWRGNTHAFPGNKKLTIDPGPYPQDQPKQNSVRFTPTQIGAILSGIQPGLTMVVGPPGTGKTDTAVQILNILCHNCPSQRTLIITHSNQALNDLFEKIMQRDVPARYLLRLGQGEQELANDLDFSRQGRVSAMLVRCLELLNEVERLARSLQLPEDVGYTCETAGYFWLLYVYSSWEQFLASCEDNKDKPNLFRTASPLRNSFPTHLSQFLLVSHLRKTCGKLREECRAFELLKSTADQANYLVTKQAKIVAMTCTHAALKRKDFLQLGFKYDNLLMEESVQILEIETFIPMLLQRQEDGYARLKCCILIGDHHQLSPAVKNMAFQKYSQMDQSLFTRFVRLGIPYIELNAQGRARPSIAKLYNWRCRDLEDLPYVREGAIFHKAGFTYEYQLVDVPDYHGRGDTAPSPWFYQNEGEAEYLVSVYIYMLDKFQGQQNDFTLLSLVRTRFVGHLRDVRRLVVAMSCYELQPTFQLLLQRPDHLALNLNEISPCTERPIEDIGQTYLVSSVEEMDHIVIDKMNQLYHAGLMNYQFEQHYSSNISAPANGAVDEMDGIESVRNGDLPLESQLNGERDAKINPNDENGVASESTNEEKQTKE